MKSIKLTKKDIKQIAESCVKNILKEDFFQNNMNNQYDNDEEEFETDNEPYFSQQDNHRNILIYLNNICKGIGGSTDYYDGYYVLNEKEDLIQIMLSFNPNNGELYVYDVEILTKNEARPDGLKLHRDKAFQAELRKLVENDLRTKVPVTLAMDYDGKTYLVQYRQIKDISQEPVGYFFSYKEDREIQAFAAARKIVIFLATVIMLILIISIAFMYISQREIQRMAVTDNLTSVYNRHSFYALAGRETARADRAGEPLSIAMVDIDFFKKVNDNYGHAMGDQVLKTTAGRIKNSVRKTDVLARYGGEEFIVLMPSTDSRDAFTIAERIRNSIEGCTFENMGGITVSIGLSERVDKEIIDDVINRADVALYRAKEAGRNRTVVYE